MHYMYILTLVYCAETNKSKKGFFQRSFSSLSLYRNCDSKKVSGGQASSQDNATEIADDGKLSSKMSFGRQLSSTSTVSAASAVSTASVTSTTTNPYFANLTAYRNLDKRHKERDDIYKRYSNPYHLHYGSENKTCTNANGESPDDLSRKPKNKYLSASTMTLFRSSPTKSRFNLFSHFSFPGSKPKTKAKPKDAQGMIKHETHTKKNERGEQNEDIFSSKNLNETMYKVIRGCDTCIGMTFAVKKDFDTKVSKEKVECSENADLGEPAKEYIITRCGESIEIKTKEHKNIDESQEARKIKIDTVLQNEDYIAQNIRYAKEETIKHDFLEVLDDNLSVSSFSCFPHDNEDLSHCSLKRGYAMRRKDRANLLKGKSTEPEAFDTMANANKGDDILPNNEVQTNASISCNMAPVIKKLQTIDIKTTKYITCEHKNICDLLPFTIL